MDAQFWHQRWQLGEIGFHKSRVNPLLTRWWSALTVPDGARVLVPLCGKSIDMLWLLQQGYAVCGVELSRAALDAFEAEQGLQLHWRERHDFQVGEQQGLKLFCGDFFALHRRDLDRVVAVYDRAALIALPVELRRDYAAHLRAQLPANWRMLLITLDYDQTQRPGPPFSVPDDEVHRLFAGCRISLLDEQDVLEDHQVFKAQGMTALSERVYLIQSPD